MKSPLTYFLAFFSILIVFSCGDKEEIPQGIIEREMFIDILADVQIFESTDQFIRNKSLEFDLDSSYHWLLEEKNITEDDFNNSLDYYTSDPKLFEELYDEVISSITQKQVEVTKKPED